MIVTIFGATGTVGKQLVKHALFQGYTVRAFGRNVFTASFTDHKELQLIQGALFDAAQVLDAIKGADVVLSALGGSFDGLDKSRSLGMKNITEQMSHAGVKRIIAIGGMGCLDGSNHKLIMEQPEFPAQYLAVSNEHLEAYHFLKASSLTWTFVCPPDIMNEDASGTYHTAASIPPTSNQYKINAGNLAMFMVDEIKKNEYLLQRVGISN